MKKKILNSIIVSTIIVSSLFNSNYVFADELNEQHNHVSTEQHNEILVEQNNEVLLKSVEELIEENKEYLGEFKLTAYCACSKCCGKYGKTTASGTIPEEGRTIAVDKKLIPFGSKVMIDGKTYIAEDTGGAIKGNRIDIFFKSHKDALKFGVKKNIEVFLITDISQESCQSLDCVEQLIK